MTIHVKISSSYYNGTLGDGVALNPDQALYLDRVSVTKITAGYIQN